MGYTPEVSSLQEQLFEFNNILLPKWLMWNATADLLANVPAVEEWAAPVEDHAQLPNRPLRNAPTPSVDVDVKEEQFATVVPPEQPVPMTAASVAAGLDNFAPVSQKQNWNWEFKNSPLSIALQKTVV